MSANNSCGFLGRVASDIKVTSIGQGQNAFNKVNFNIAVDRKLSKKEKQDKANGVQVKTASFPPMEATGALADMIAQYFAKGKPIMVSSYYEDFSYDKGGQKVYGHKFIIESVNFVPSDSTQGGGQQNNYQQNKNVSNNMNNNYEYPVNQDDMPF